METRRDFLQCLPPEVSVCVLGLLDDPRDLVRASAVSRSWHQFVIVNKFCKRLLSKLHPEALNFVRIIETRTTVEPMEAGPSTSHAPEQLNIEHKIYALFLQLLRSPYSSRNCVLEAIAASSTDNYPDETIKNTLEPDERVNGRPSYWSSKGQKDPGIPETLTYKLKSNLCIVDQIDIQPFEAYFQDGNPIYSSQAVRFKMGYSLTPEEAPTDDVLSGSQNTAANNYVWTYVSPIYPMIQENILQPFKLPKPVLCGGGIVQVELLGRVQTQETDALYYICVCHVKINGRPLSPAFDVGLLDAPGEFVLKYSVDAANRCLNGSLEYDSDGSSNRHHDNSRSPSWHNFAERIRQEGARRGWNEILMTLLAEGQLAIDESDEDEPLY